MLFIRGLAEILKRNRAVRECSELIFANLMDLILVILDVCRTLSDDGKFLVIN